MAGEGAVSSHNLVPHDGLTCMQREYYTILVPQVSYDLVPSAFF